jgi:hypothetical protein
MKLPGEDFLATVKWGTFLPEQLDDVTGQRVIPTFHLGVRINTSGLVAAFKDLFVNPKRENVTKLNSYVAFTSLNCMVDIDLHFLSGFSFDYRGLKIKVYATFLSLLKAYAELH